MKTIGILGGMGPEAGADLFVRIIRLYQKNGAIEDSDFPNIILNSINARMPWQRAFKHRNSK